MEILAADQLFQSPMDLSVAAWHFGSKAGVQFNKRPMPVFRFELQGGKQA